MSKRFGPVEVLRRLELEVHRGEWVAVTGPSGCGKSTLLHLLAALDHPTSGLIRVNGHDLAHLHAANRYRRTEIGVVFQLHNLLPHLTAGRNVEIAMFGAGRHRRARRARAIELLDELELAQAVDRTPPHLSGGERQRVAIARALANEPAILLADEPTGSLDEDATDLVLDLFERHRAERRMTMLVVTHDRTVVGRADRTIALDLGEGR